MKYFRLFDDVNVPARWHLGEIFEQGGNLSLELQDGTPAHCRFPLRVEITHPGIALDFCLTSFAVPVATTKLGVVIASIAGLDLQRLPLEIRGHEGLEVLNSTRVIKCLDEKRSEFMKWTDKDHRADLAGQYRMVTKLKIDSRELPTDAHFFRIEGWRIALIVSEQVKIAMEICGCRGAAFQDITE
jgi:hypothetical protein